MDEPIYPPVQFRKIGGSIWAERRLNGWDRAGLCTIGVPFLVLGFVAAFVLVATGSVSEDFLFALMISLGAAGSLIGVGIGLVVDFVWTWRDEKTGRILTLPPVVVECYQALFAGTTVPQPVQRDALVANFDTLKHLLEDCHDLFEALPQCSKLQEDEFRNLITERLRPIANETIKAYQAAVDALAEEQEIRRAGIDAQLRQFGAGELNEPPA